MTQDQQLHAPLTFAHGRCPSQRTLLERLSVVSCSVIYPYENLQARSHQARHATLTCDFAVGIISCLACRIGNSPSYTLPDIEAMPKNQTMPNRVATAPLYATSPQPHGSLRRKTLHAVLPAFLPEERNPRASHLPVSVSPPTSSPTSRPKTPLPLFPLPALSISRHFCCRLCKGISHLPFCVPPASPHQHGYPVSFTPSRPALASRNVSSPQTAWN